MPMTAKELDISRQHRKYGVYTKKYVPVGAVIHGMFNCVFVSVGVGSVGLWCCVVMLF